MQPEAFRQGSGGEGGPPNRRRRRGGGELLLLLVIPTLGIVCLLLAAQLAVMPARVWQAPASMLSEMDPDRNYGTSEVYLEPLRPEIMTPQPWDPILILTPGGEVDIIPPLVFVPVPTATPLPVAGVTATPTPRPTFPAPSPTPLPTSTPVPPTPTPRPPTATPTYPPTPTPTPTFTPLPPTPTPIPPTPTPRPPTPTFTPTPAGPRVFSIVPNIHVNTTTVDVTITGENFQFGCAVALGSVPLTVINCLATTITARVPADLPVGSFPAGVYDLTVTNPDGRSGLLTGAYTATNPIPVISRVYPAIAPEGAVQAITITGSFFRSTGAPPALRAWLWDGTPMSLSDLAFVSESTLTATVPYTMPLGGYTLYVANPGPTDPTGSLQNAFSVYALPVGVTCTPPIPADLCQRVSGEPDGNVLEFSDGEVIVDFGAGGITDGPGYDLVFYEYYNYPGIHMDFIRVEVSPDGTGWYAIFEWDGVPGGVNGTNIDDFAGDGEVENEEINEANLYPSDLPHNTGIAIDLSAWGLSGPFQYVRFTDPDPGGAEPSQIDAVLRLH